MFIAGACNRARESGICPGGGYPATRRLSHEAARSGNDGRARRYVDIAVRICRKTRTRMPRDFRFCKGCGVPLLPGVTSRVRLTGGKVVCTCLRCGRAARMPYQRERRA